MTDLDSFRIEDAVALRQGGIQSEVEKVVRDIVKDIKLAAVARWSVVYEFEDKFEASKDVVAILEERGFSVSMANKKNVDGYGIRRTATIRWGEGVTNASQEKERQRTASGGAG